MDLPKEPVMFFKATTALVGPDDPVRDPARRHQARLGSGARGRDRRARLVRRRGARARSRRRLRAAQRLLRARVPARARRPVGEGQERRHVRADRPVPRHARRDPDPQALGMWLTVNGETRQQGTTANMVFGVATLVSYVSQFMTLLPGDVISTGTPAGRRARHEAGARLPAARRRRRARHRRPRPLAAGSGGASMTRHVLAVDLKDDPAVIEAYTEHHRRVWPEVLRSLRARGHRRHGDLPARPAAGHGGRAAGRPRRPARLRGARRLASARRRMGGADEVDAGAAARAPRPANGGRRCSRSSISMKTPGPDLTQAWPRPSQPRPIVIIGAGAIVRTAHLPAIAASAIPSPASSTSTRSARAPRRASSRSTRVFPSLAEAARARRTRCSTSPCPAIRSSASSSSCRDGAAVLMQKPMGQRPRRRASASSRAARERELTAAVNFQLRFSPAMLALRDLLDARRARHAGRHRRPHRDRPAVAPVDVPRTARRGSRCSITRSTTSTRSAGSPASRAASTAAASAHPSHAAAARHAQLDHPRLRRRAALLARDEPHAPRRPAAPGVAADGRRHSTARRG